MLTTLVTDISQRQATPKSDIFCRIERGAFHTVNGRRERMDPKAYDEKTRSPRYRNGITVLVKFMCHLLTPDAPTPADGIIDFPKLGKVRSITLERTFRPVADDGSWNDAEINAYFACIKNFMSFIDWIGDIARKNNGLWDEPTCDKAYAHFQKLQQHYAFVLPAQQLPYWGKDEDGRKYFTKDGPGLPGPSRDQPIANPDLNAPFLDPLDSDTPDA